MVRGLHSEILMKDSKFIGFNLGTDYSYVHENGFDGIIKMFQMEINSNKTTGHVTTIPEELLMTDVTISDKTYVLLLGIIGLKQPELAVCDYDFLVNSELYTNSLLRKGFNCAWDKNGFGIIVKEEYRDYISELYESFKSKDVSFSLGCDICDNLGLKIYIISRIK